VEDQRDRAPAASARELELIAKRLLDVDWVKYVESRRGAGCVRQLTRNVISALRSDE
jgi:hypothetical protein